MNERAACGKMAAMWQRRSPLASSAGESSSVYIYLWAYLPVSLPSVHKVISCPHWSCARSCVLEEGHSKEVADLFRSCIFKFLRTRARGGRYHKIWIRTDTKYFRASIADIDTDTFKRLM